MLVLQFSGSIGGTGAVLLAYGIAMMIGGVCGAFNGIIVHYLGIPAMLATLGTMQIFQGIAIIITNGSAVTGMDLSLIHISCRGHAFRKYGYEDDPSG